HPPEISNVTSVPPVFVQKLPQNYLYYIIPFYSRFYLCMQKFTCGSNAHNSPSFITHSGLWAWNSPHPLPSASVPFLSLGSDSPVNSQSEERRVGKECRSRWS